MEALQTTTNQLPTTFISQAIEKGLGIEHLEKLMDLQERWEKNNAKKTFLDALSKFQSQVPVLEKTKQVSFNSTRYKYAPLGEITQTIKETLTNNGLSYRWEIDDSNGSIQCTCKISHVDGHTETTTMSADKDKTGNKNDIQSRGSTITYLQRYTLIAALGISTADEDNDGRTQEPQNKPKLTETPAQNKPKEPNYTEIAEGFKTVEELKTWYKGLNKDLQVRLKNLVAHCKEKLEQPTKADEIIPSMINNSKNIEDLERVDNLINSIKDKAQRAEYIDLLQEKTATLKVNYTIKSVPF